MDFFPYLYTFMVALASCLAITPFIIRLAKTHGLTETNNERKIHRERISSLGGIGIVLASLLAIALTVQPDLDSPVLAFGLGLPLMVLGIIDDRYQIGVTTRLISQAVLGTVLFEMGFQFVLVENWWLLNLGATLFFVLLLINAYNFMDGINGLAGGLGILGSVVFGGMLATRGEVELSLACFGFAGGLLGFLFFNFGEKAKIFMGDNGSTVLGFFMALMVLALLRPSAGTPSSEHWPLLAAVLLVPVVDLFKVALFRVAKLRSPFWADRSHLHHLFVDRGLSHSTTCGLIFGTVILAVAAAAFSPTIEFWKTLPILMMVPYAAALVVGSVMGSVKSPHSGAPKVEKPTLQSILTN